MVMTTVMSTEPEVYISEGQPQANVTLPRRFSHRRMASGDHSTRSASFASLKEEAMQALFSSVANNDGTRVETDGLLVLVSKLLCSGHDGRFLGVPARSVTLEYCSRLMALLDRSGNGFLQYDDFRVALDIFVNDQGQPTNFQRSLLMADTLALHEQVIDLTEELEMKQKEYMTERQKLEKQLQILRQQLHELDQQNNSVLEEADTEMIVLQKENLQLKTELVRAKSYQSLHELAREGHRSSSASPDPSVASAGFDVRLSVSADPSPDAEVESLRAQLDAMSQEFDALEKELRDEKIRTADLQDELIQTSQELRETRSRRSRAEYQLNNVTADFNRLNTELQELRRGRQSHDLNGLGYAMALGVELQVEAIKSENEVLHKSNQELNDLLRRKTTELQEIKAALEAAISQLTKDLATEQSNSKSLTSTVTSLQTEIKTLRSKLRTQDINEAASAQIKELQHNLTAKEAQLSETQRVLDGVRSELTRLRNDYAEQRIKLSNAQQQYEQKWHELDGRYEQQRHEVGRLSTLVEKKDAELSTLKELLTDNAATATPMTTTTSSSSSSQPSPQISSSKKEFTPSRRFDLPELSSRTEERLRRLENEKAHLQKAVIAHKREEADLLAEISRLQRRLLEAEKAAPKPAKAVSAAQPTLSMKELLDGMSKLRLQQRTSIQQQMRDVECAKRAMHSAIANSRLSTKAIDHLRSSIATKETGLESDLASSSGDSLLGMQSTISETPSVYHPPLLDPGHTSIRRTFVRVAGAIPEPITFDVHCQPSSASLLYGLHGQCQVVLSASELRVVQLPTRRTKVWAWEQISRLVRTVSSLSIHVDNFDGRELELRMVTADLNGFVAAFSRFT
eukprot:m.189442 g.189442  ORF g.189442 m.189442 type:complete len:856 (+) comp16745_c1_seq6:208-2775(+)